MDGGVTDALRALRDQVEALTRVVAVMHNELLAQRMALAYGTYANPCALTRAVADEGATHPNIRLNICFEDDDEDSSDETSLTSSCTTCSCCSTCPCNRADEQL